MLYAKDLCQCQGNDINPLLVTIPEDYKLNTTGLILWDKIQQDVFEEKFKDELHYVCIAQFFQSSIVNKYAYGIRKSDGFSIKTGPIVFGKFIENGWLYTLNGSLYKIGTLST